MGLYLPLALAVFALHESISKLFLDYLDLPQWQKTLFIYTDVAMLAGAMWLISYAINHVSNTKEPTSQVPAADEQASEPRQPGTAEALESACQPGTA